MNNNIPDHSAGDQQNLDKDLAKDRAKEIEAEFLKNSLPDGFKLDENGLWHIPKERVKGGEENFPIWICSPLFITAWVRDQENENHGRLLEFKDIDQHHHSLIIPMEFLAGDGTKCIEELLRLGLLLGVGKKIKTLLIQYIQLSQPRARARFVSQTGWVKNNFVFPKETIMTSQTEKFIYQNFSSHKLGYGQAGGLEEWQEIANLCRGNSRLTFALSASFATSLLFFLGEENGGFHFRGPSSIGKTTVLKVAASAWGGKEFLQRWRSTSNGLEGIAAGHNDSLLCLDEIEQMHPTEIGEVAYMLANGTGKGRADRSGSARKKASWRLLFISTGEISLADHLAQVGKKVRAGQEVRVLDIPADTGKHGIFEVLHDFENGAHLADRLSDLCRQYYGVASRIFLSELISSKENSLKEINSIVKSLEKRELPQNANGQVVRAFKRFALVAAAGEMATRFGITNWNSGDADLAAMKCFNDWLVARGYCGLQEEKIALAQVKKFFEQNGESNFSPWGEDPMSTKTIKRAGFKKQTEDGIEYYVFTETFRTEICSGLDPSFVAQVCIKAGWLIPSSDGKPTRSERLWNSNGKGTTRCYRFSPKVLNNDG